MSFTAFGRGCEQNGSSPDFHPVVANGISNGNGKHRPPFSGIGDANGNAHANGTSQRSELDRSTGDDHRIASLRSTLSSGVSIKGVVKFRSELVIDGNFEGTIQSLGRLTVGRNGHVRGDIESRSATIHGTVDGNLSVAGTCELRSGCTVRGDIESSRLVVDDDVTFVGRAAIATRDYLSELRPFNGYGNGNGERNKFVPPAILSAGSTNQAQLITAAIPASSASRDPRLLG